MTIQLAAKSTFVLGEAFWTAVRGGGGATTATPVNLDGPCPITNGQTFFYFFGGKENTDPCAGMDWYILAFLTLIVHAISWFGRWLVWEPGATAIAKSIKHPTFDHYTARKISTNMTECLFFVLSGFFAYRIFFDKWWLYEPDVWLEGREDWHVDAAIKFYYILYAARFVSDFISVFSADTRNNTALVVACIHHCVTLGLIATAIYGNYIRGAAVIMSFFDWADPFVLLAKTCRNLTKHPNDWFQFLANRCFEGFAISFFLTRSVIYNYVTYKFMVNLAPDAYIEKTLLILLVMLQTYWLGLIINAAVRSAQNGGNVEEDDREKKKNQ